MTQEEFLAEARRVWKKAGEFPFYKEKIYPEHLKVQEFHLHHGKRVLEYGCGAGSDARCYLERGCRVMLMDIVPENLVAAEGNLSRCGFKRGVNFECWPLEMSAPIPFSDALYDLVNAHGVLHHIPDPRPLVEEFYRLLRPGGYLYAMLYTEMLRTKYENQIQRLMETGMSEEQAFGQCTDGANYSVAYVEEEGRALLSPPFQVVSAVVYNKGDFRTFKAVK